MSNDSAPSIDWSGGIIGACPVQGFGTIDVDGEEYDVYFRSRGGHWSLAIGSGNERGYVAGETSRWFWSGLDGTAWGLHPDRVRELATRLLAMPHPWPTAAVEGNYVTLSVPVALGSGPLDVADTMTVEAP